MLRRRNSLNTSEIMVVILLPFIGIIFSSELSWIVVIAMYMGSLAILSQYSFERSVKGRYGHKTYERPNDVKLTQRVFFNFLGFQIFVICMTLFMNQFDIVVKNGLLIYVLMNSTMLLYLCKKKIKVQFFEKGLLYRGRFHYWHHVHEGILVKNYYGQYEVHLSVFKPRIILYPNEMKIVKSLQIKGK